VPKLLKLFLRSCLSVVFRRVLTPIRFAVPVIRFRTTDTEESVDNSHSLTSLKNAFHKLHGIRSIEVVKYSETQDDIKLAISLAAQVAYIIAHQLKVV